MPATSVYIIEDDPVFAKFLAHQLDANGMTSYKSFTRGDHALEAVSTDKPNSILLDFGLDGLNGLDLLRAFKKISKRMKVFIITGIEDDDVERRCLENGADLFIRKSQVVSALPANLVEALKKKRGLFSFG